MNINAAGADYSFWGCQVWESSWADWMSNNDAAAWCRHTFLCNYHKLITGHSLGVDASVRVRAWLEAKYRCSCLTQGVSLPAKTPVYMHSCLPDPNVSITAETPLCQCRDLLVPVYFHLSSPQSSSRTMLFLFTWVCRQEIILKHELY